MRLVFFGTPEFATISLLALHQAGHNIAAVVTAPDSPGRRHHSELITSAVKKAALELHLPLLQPKSLRSKSFFKELQSLDAEIFIVVAFRMLPERVWDMPPRGSINLHGSLLPAYRGAAPINWVIINGEKRTGVSIFKLEHEIDSGKIILQREVNILPEDDFGSLYDKMKVIGAETLIEALEKIKTGTDNSVVQDDNLISNAPKLTPENTLIDFAKTNLQIVNLVRGLSPYPTAWFSFEGQKMKVFKCHAEQTKLAVGTWKSDFKHRLILGCGVGSVSLEIIQLEGKRKMTISEFLNGLKRIDQNKI